MELTPETIRSVTHDMRNLLTAVRGHAELALRSMSSDDPVREDVAHLVVVTATIFDLIDQLDGADSSGSRIAVDLDASVRSMRRLLDALLPPSIALDISLGSEGAFVNIARLRIERIVLNLVVNARDAMEDGGSLAIRTGRPDEGRATIVVADTGPGFSEEALAHLFEDGFTTKADRGGSGRGLSALAPFVNGAGGSVDVDSVPGRGATITVTLPAVDPLALVRPEPPQDGAAAGDREAGT
jgi:two-component system cell cycle sensor histidine kinase/response regulator CckA